MLKITLFLKKILNLIGIGAAVLIPIYLYFVTNFSKLNSEDASGFNGLV